MYPYSWIQISRSRAEFLENHRSKVPIEPSQEEIDIKNAIDRIHYDEPSFGRRRIKNELKKLGFKSVGKKRVRRYVCEMAGKSMQQSLPLNMTLLSPV